MAPAKTSKSRAWFFPTSPRSPHKLQGELRLLKQLEGRPWNKETQLAFAKLLQEYPEFDGNISASAPDFSARDRATRAPRLLGFIHFPKKGRQGPLQFTAMGNLFLEAQEAEQGLIFQRQLAKVQFKSPLHDSGGFEDMSVRPLTVMIKLLLALNNMSKEEVALFATTLINHEEFDERLQTIKDYRGHIGSLGEAKKRKQFRRDFALNWVAQIYGQDIDLGRTHLREGGADFLRTKYQTLRDYADSTIRYLRSTGLFTLTPHGQRLTLINASTDDAKFLLEQHGIGLSAHASLPYDDYVTRYLGNPSLPEIRKDSPSRQAEDLTRLVAALAAHDPHQAGIYRQDYALASSKSEKLRVLCRLEESLRDVQIKHEAKGIRQDIEESLADIKNTYQAIASKQSELLDKPLMYEWNTWRAMVLINDARNVQGNYVADAEGNPLFTAGGKQPDILVEYDSFWLAVEVTLQKGQRQYETEGEPISRHVGQLQAERHANGDHRPVFGLFVAETINNEVIAHLITQARFASQVYRGPIRIVPMRRELFEAFMASTLRHPGFSHHLLQQFFEAIFSKETLAQGELDWAAQIEARVHQFPRFN